MPILSLNSHNLPTGTNSYSALGLSGTGPTAGLPPLGASLTHPSIPGLDTSALLGTSGLTGLGTGLAGTSSLYGLGSGVSGLAPGLQNTFGPPPSFLDVASSASYPFTSAALRNATKMKMLEEIDIPLTRYGNRSSPCSPIPPNTWGLDEFQDSLMHSRSGLALAPLDLESKYLRFLIVRCSFKSTQPPNIA